MTLQLLVAIGAVSPFLSDRRQVSFIKPATEWVLRSVLRDPSRESLLLTIISSGLQNGFVTRQFARLVGEDLSWIGKLVIFDATQEMGTVAQQNQTSGEAMVVAMIIATNYGRTISQDGWGRAQVMRVRLANRRLQATIRSVDELGAAHDNAPAMPRLSTTDEDEAGTMPNMGQDDSGVTQDMDEDKENTIPGGDTA